MEAWLNHTSECQPASAEAQARLQTAAAPLQADAAQLPTADARLPTVVVAADSHPHERQLLGEPSLSEARPEARPRQTRPRRIRGSS
eukprot:7118890-Pyramimonas_sp.AAC.1